MKKDMMLRALTCLDQKLSYKDTLIVGGESAMVLGHGIASRTDDVNAVPRSMDLQKLDPYIKAVAQELSLPSDWLNPWFATFSHTLPPDYGDRLIDVFSGTNLSAQALSLNEMLIMKCFAHRQKDIGHAKALIKKGADTEFVKTHIEKLLDEGIYDADKAIEFLEDIEDQLE